MRCPTLNELPPPPPGKTGWPWTEDTPYLPDLTPTGQSWPKISVITPSYNQGQFLEETIRSVLLQGYPDLEYILIDGGSTDESVKIIHKYESWLDYWVSEPDRGQSSALNKGFARSTGTIMAWINSDDRLQPQAIQTGVKFFGQHPDVGIVYGDFNRINEAGDVQAQCHAADFDLSRQIVHNLVPQPTAFFRRAVWEQIGPLNNDFHYIMDYDLWTRAARRFFISHIPALMADIRFHKSSKSVGQTIGFTYEFERFFDNFFGLPDLPPQLRGLEAQARGANLFVRGRLCLKASQRLEARLALERAWRLYPQYPGKLAILPFWLDTLLNTNIGLPLLRLILGFKHRSGCLDEETL